MFTLAMLCAVPSLHAIRLEADDIISRLRITIRESLRDERKALTDSRVVDCITLLVNLAEPRAALRDLYLRTQQRRLQEILTTFQRELTAQPELPVSRLASGSDVVASETDAAIRMLPRNDAATFVAWINEGFLDQVRRCCGICHRGVPTFWTH